MNILVLHYILPTYNSMRNINFDYANSWFILPIFSIYFWSIFCDLWSLERCYILYFNKVCKIKQPIKNVFCFSNFKVFKGQCLSPQPLIILFSFHLTVSFVVSIFDLFVAHFVQFKLSVRMCLCVHLCLLVCFLFLSICS